MTITRMIKKPTSGVTIASLLFAASASLCMAASAEPQRVHAERPARTGIIEPAKIAPDLGKTAPAEPWLIPNVFPEPSTIPRGDEPKLDLPAASGEVIRVTDASGPSQPVTTAFPAVDVRFDGPIDVGVAPPDSVIAAGRTHVVCLVNSRIAMYTKQGTLAQGPFSLASFFGIPSGFGVFDPLAVYDPFSDRFIVAVLADNGAAQDARIFVAFSQTGDPTAAWNYYWIDADAGQPNNWADYGSIGIDRLAVYFTANMFVRSGGYSNVTLFIYNKEDGYAGLPLRNTHLIDVRTEGNGSPYRLRPAHVQSVVPGDEFYLAHTDASFGDRINLWRLTGDRFGTPVLAASSVALPGLFFAPGRGRQPGSPKQVDSLGSNLWNVFYENGRLWTAQAVRGSQGAAAWVSRLDVFGVPAARETTYQIEVTGRDTFFPYVVPDTEDNDFALLTAFSGPDLYVTGRYWNIDAAGTVRSAELLANGTVPNTSGRHGDYFAVGSDPRDRNRVWMVAQYMQASTFTANSIIASTRFEDVPPPSEPPPVPDGKTVGGKLLTVMRAAGDDLTVQWDATRCPAGGYHLVWYDLSALATYAIAGETCAAGMTGSWTGLPPAGNIGVLAVSDDAATVEGSFGKDSAGSERPSQSLTCGFTQKTTTGTCGP